MRKFFVISISVSMVIFFSAAVFAEEGISAKTEGCKKGIAAMVSGNAAIAVEILQPLADAGDACAQCTLGSMYKDGNGVQKDKERGLALLRKSADQGYVEAQIIVGPPVK